MAKTYWPVAFTCGGIIPCAFTHYSTTQYPQTGWSIDTIAPLVQLLKGPNPTAHFGSAMSWTIWCLEKTKTLWIHLHYRLLALVEKEQYFNMMISFLKKLGLPCVTDADVDRFRMADTHPTFIKDRLLRIPYGVVRFVTEILHRALLMPFLAHGTREFWLLYSRKIRAKEWGISPLWRHATYMDKYNGSRGVLFALCLNDACHWLSYYQDGEYSLL